MSFHRSVRLLDLQPKPSKQLYHLLLLIHFLALVSIMMPTTLAWYIRSAVFLLILISIWKTLYKKDFVKFTSGRWLYDDTLILQHINGMQISTVLRPGCVVSEWLVILHLIDADKNKYAWILVRDMLEADIYRQLCVRVRQYKFSDVDN